jgi:uridylate kinase
MADTIILSLGGSLIYPQEIDVEYLKQFRELILSCVQKGMTFGIVCGGGSIARMLIKKGNEITSLTSLQNDILGIAGTKVNAQIVREMFGDIAYPSVITNYSKKISSSQPIVVGAGWQPGCSTDKDAVLLADSLGANTIVNLTNVDYVYTKDPRKYPDAKPIVKTTWKEFKAIVGGEWKAGMNLPFDPIAAQLAEKKKFTVVIMNGKPLDNLEAYLAGKKFKGSVIE